MTRRERLLADGAEVELRFADDLNPGALRLLEIPAELEHVFAGLVRRDGEPPQTLVIRGVETDSATLHTADRSFNIKDVHTSNTMLIVQPSDDEQQLVVQDTASNVLEVTAAVPVWDRLRLLLRDALYEGEELEDRPGQRRNRHYTLSELQQVVQASDAELLAALRTLDALPIHGVYRVLAPSYMQEVLTLVFSTAVAEGWPLDALSLDKCQRVLQSEDNVLPAVTEHVLQVFANAQDGNTWAVCPSKVCRFMAKMLFENAADGMWKREEFLNAWREHVPEQYQVDASVLKDMSVETQDPISGVSYLQYIAVASLSSKPVERLAQLFAVKTKWTRDEIMPFVSDLVLERKKVEPMLIKHARVVRTKDGIHYIARTS
ncbi:Ctf8p and Ctf18p associating protein [Sorochytrium milnesiophthora]